MGIEGDQCGYMHIIIGFKENIYEISAIEMEMDIMCALEGE